MIIYLYIAFNRLNNIAIYMKKEKQLKILALFKSKAYRCENDKVYQKRKGLWKEVKAGKLPSGYQQIFFKSGDELVICYKHVAIYLYYNENMTNGLKLIMLTGIILIIFR